MAHSTRTSPHSRGRVLTLVGSVVVAVLWVIVPHPLEGPIVYVLTVNHGIHQWDFLAMVPVLGWLLWWTRDH